MSVCLGGFVILLIVIAVTRHIPAENEEMSGREALREFVVPFVVGGFATASASG